LKQVTGAKARVFILVARAALKAPLFHGGDAVVVVRGQSQRQRTGVSAPHGKRRSSTVVQAIGRVDGGGGGAGETRIPRFARNDNILRMNDKIVRVNDKTVRMNGRTVRMNGKTVKMNGWKLETGN